MGFFEQEDVGEGDEFLSVQPWKNQFRPPQGWSMPEKSQQDQPYVDV